MRGGGCVCVEGKCVCMYMYVYVYVLTRMYRIIEHRGVH